MSVKRRKVGLAGEKAARSYLESVGYVITEVNYRCPLGEIDIVAQDGKTVVIVEVRTKTSSVYGRPDESITAVKYHRLYRLAQYYLNGISKPAAACRIDLVAVMLDKNTFNVEYLHHYRAINFG